VKVLLILIQFDYVTNKLVTESKEILVFILFYDICSDMTGKITTRWEAAVNTKHLLRLAVCWAETRRGKKYKTVLLSWETLYYLYYLHTLCV
jgi:hypothetical protein